MYNEILENVFRILLMNCIFYIVILDFRSIKYIFYMNNNVRLINKNN